MKFKNLAIDKTPITEYELLMSEHYDNYRLYVNKKEHYYDAVILIFESCEYEKDQNIWNDTTECYVMFHIRALWDGTRHLYCEGDDDGDKGYLYYPSMPTIIKMFQRLQELSKEMGIEEV